MYCWTGKQGSGVVTHPRRSHPGQGHSQCKGPEVGACCSACSRHGQEACGWGEWREADGDCWLGKEGWNPGSPATPSQAPAARSRHGSPDRPRVPRHKSHYIVFMFHFVFFFLLSYYCLTLGEAKDIIYSSLLYQICVKHLIKRCFHTARD